MKTSTWTNEKSLGNTEGTEKTTASAEVWVTMLKRPRLTVEAQRAPIGENFQALKEAKQELTALTKECEWSFHELCASRARY